MYRSDWEEFAGFIAATVLFTAFVLGPLLGIAMVGDYYGCHRGWASSGMSVSWGPVQGCLVEASPGKWVPAKAYREVRE